MAIALLVAALAGGLAVYARVKRPPNVVFIVIDTLRADHVGAYGAAQNLTPQLDAIAAESTLFEHAYATSAWTKSSIASMLTGHYPSHIGVLDRDDAIPESIDTLAERLHRRGYETHGVTSNGNAGATYGFAQGFDSFEYPSEQRRYPGGATTFPANGITNAALEWLAQRNRAQPFFLFLHYADPHDPYFPHPDLDCGDEPPGRFGGSRQELREMDAAGKRGELTETDKARIRYLYACDVRFCDQWIGTLATELRRQGLWENSLLVITADHGEGLWDHSERGHGRDLYEEMVRVPLLVKYPGKARAARIRKPVSLVDLTPTVLVATGVGDDLTRLQGQDLGALLASADPEPHHGIYSELSLDQVDLESLRTPEHTLLRARKLPFDDPTAYQLFDRRSDPGEHDDIALSSSATGAVKQYLRYWHDFIQPASAGERNRVALEDLSPAELKSLRDLGYISDVEYQEAAQRRAQAQAQDGS